MRTVLLTDVAIRASKSIVRQDIRAKSFFLQDRELNKIGTENKCLSCGELFTIGDAELHRFSHEKGKPKKVVELCHATSEAFIDVNLTLNPLDLSKYSKADQAIIYGVECVNMHLCPSCTKENSEYSAEIGGRNVGAEIQRGSTEE
jgi:hypothetical protein